MCEKRFPEINAEDIDFILYCLVIGKYRCKINSLDSNSNFSRAVIIYITRLLCSVSLRRPFIVFDELLQKIARHTILLVASPRYAIKKKAVKSMQFVVFSPRRLVNFQKQPIPQPGQPLDQMLGC